MQTPYWKQPKYSSIGDCVIVKELENYIYRSPDSKYFQVILVSASITQLCCCKNQPQTIWKQTGMAVFQ